MTDQGKLLPIKPGIDPKAKVMPDGKAAGAGAVLALCLGIAYALSPSEGGQRLDVYLDSAGIPTACTGIIGPEVTRRWKANGKNARFTKAECDKLDSGYALNMSRQMAACIAPMIRGRITFGELIAYGHWAYNTGTGTFCSMGSVPRLLAQGDRVGACKAMGAYTWSRPNPKGGQTGRTNGKAGAARRVDCADPRNKCRGLAIRRELEVNTCLAYQ